MRVSTARNVAGERRVVLTMTRTDERELWTVDLLHKHGKRKSHGLESVEYRFPIRMLERVALTFPFSERSLLVDKALRMVSEYDPHQPISVKADIRLELMHHQKVAVEALVKSDRFFLFDSMGLGKTAAVLAAISYLGATPALIVCPNSAKWDAWERQTLAYTDLHPTVVDGTATERRAAIEYGDDLTIIHYEALRLHPELAERRYEVVVGDEIQRCKNPAAQQTKAFLALEAERFWLLSGTAVMNRPTETFSMLHRMWPDLYPDFWSFQRWLTIKVAQGRFNKTIAYRPSAMRAIREDLLSPDHSMRRRREQVLTGIPQVLPLPTSIDINKEQRRIYDRIADEAKLEMANGTITSIPGILAKITRLKQACFSPELFGGSAKSAKLDELAKILEELTSTGDKAIIFSQWARATQILRREFAQYNPAYVDGHVKGRDRQAQIDRFNQVPDCHLYIGTIGSNKEAISLGAATYVIFTDKDWVPGNNDQAIDRSAAGGIRGLGVDKVTVIELIARDTFEERIEGVLRGKRQIAAIMMGERSTAKVPRLTIQDIFKLI